jgi:hypothetical protein
MEGAPTILFGLFGLAGFGLGWALRAALHPAAEEAEGWRGQYEPGQVPVHEGAPLPPSFQAIPDAIHIDPVRSEGCLHCAPEARVPDFKVLLEMRKGARRFAFVLTPDCARDVGQALLRDAEQAERDAAAELEKRKAS